MLLYTNEKITRTLKIHPLFSNLTDVDRAEILGFAQLFKYPAGKTIFNEGEECKGYYIVIDGSVKLYKLSPNGEEHIVELISDGQSFAEAVLFADKPYPVYAQTLKPTELLFFPKKEYLDYLCQKPDFLLKIIASLSMRMHKLVVKIERLTLQDSIHKVASYLAENIDTATNAVELPASKNAISSYLDIEPETFSRALKILESKNFIQIDQNKRIVCNDIEALKKYSLSEI